MKSFEQLYLDTAALFEEGLFRDPKWIRAVTENLKNLKKLWPNNDYLELSEIVKDNIWRVEQIYLWSYFDEESLESNLTSHGSLNYYYLSQMIPEHTLDIMLKNFLDTNFRTSDNNHVLTEMALGEIEKLNRSTSFKKTTRDERVIEKCNVLAKDVWMELIDDCKLWEFDIKFIELLEKISKPRNKINKKDAPFFISQIEELISRKYMKEVKYQELFKIFSYV